jgi:DNA-binding MarR family transcriptional regulator
LKLVNCFFSQFALLFAVMKNSINPASDSWRHNHVGHWLRMAIERFDVRVMELMARNPVVPLGLSNLVARGQVGAAHIHITRHLALQGSRVTELAQRAGMTKQAMGTLVGQCEAWGLVMREDDANDGRARLVQFTPTGLAWLKAHEQAVAQAEDEMRTATSPEVATVIVLGLEAYCAH